MRARFEALIQREIDPIVRGHCRLRPGLENYSENVRVISILGRFPEHSRIYYFGNDGDDKVYVGSADWMRRTLNERAEAVAEVTLPPTRRASSTYSTGHSPIDVRPGFCIPTAPTSSALPPLPTRLRASRSN